MKQKRQVKSVIWKQSKKQKNAVCRNPDAVIGASCGSAESLR